MVACLMALAAAGCNSPTSLSDNVTETLSGTVQPAMSDSKTFTVGNTGEIKVTLASLTPGGDATLAVAYGQPSSGVCQIANPQPLNGTYVGKTVFDFPIYVKGDYCIVTADCSLFNASCPALTVAQNYSYQVSHP